MQPEETREINPVLMNDATTVGMVPEKFDGGNLEVFLARFELTCEVNRWVDEEEKARYLGLSLTGKLFERYLRFPEVTRRRYGLLVEELRKCVSPEEHRELRRIEFQSRVQMIDESFEYFALALEQGFDVAYGRFHDVSEPMKQEMLRDRFVAGLYDGKVRLAVRQSRPRSLSDALSHALEQATFIKLEQGATSSHCVDSARPVDRQTGDVLSSINDALSDLKNILSSQNTSVSRRPSCWYCKGSHLRRNCPELRQHGKGPHKPSREGELN